jgi:hypothetical protein
MKCALSRTSTKPRITLLEQMILPVITTNIRKLTALTMSQWVMWTPMILSMVWSRDSET